MPSKTSTQTTGYCVKCKKQQKMENAKKEKSNGRCMMKGTCKVCSTKMCKFCAC